MSQYAQNAGAKMRHTISDYASAKRAARELRNGKLGNNTWIFERPGEGGEVVVVIILHSTPIVTYHEDDSVTLNSGGYRTVTTKARMNEVVPAWVHIRQTKREWYVSAGSFSGPFYDGIRLYPKGEPFGHRRNPGSGSQRQHFAQDTWLDPEEYAYPAGSLRQSRRKFKAMMNAGVKGKDYVTGVAGIPDTYSTIPARGKFHGRTVHGYLSVGGPWGTAEGVLVFNIPETKRKNPHMERQVFQGDGWEIQLDGGESFASPEFNAPDVDELRNLIGTNRKVTIGDGLYGRVESVVYLDNKTWWGRLSAPGYLDATPWSYGTTRQEVERELDDLYGEEEEGDDDEG